MSYGLDKISLITANASITITAVRDDGAATVTLGTINNTNFSGKKKIVLTSATLKADYNYYLQLEWSNGAIFRDTKRMIGQEFNINKVRILLAQAVSASFVGTVNLPISVLIDTEDDG